MKLIDDLLDVVSGANEAELKQETVVFYLCTKYLLNLHHSWIHLVEHLLGVVDLEKRRW